MISSVSYGELGEARRGGEERMRARLKEQAGMRKRGKQATSITGGETKRERGKRERAGELVARYSRRIR